jgi:hypothetical protein
LILEKNEMAKTYTNPIIIDNLKTLSVSFLGKHGYLRPNLRQSGTVSWSQNGNRTDSISIKVNTQPESQYLELDYTCNNARVNYRVHLISSASNLGNGVVWFFICPKTGKRCRKLHLADTFFYHRSAVKGCFYESQVQSKGSRSLLKAFSSIFLMADIDEKVTAKHFKMAYKGKETKNFQRLMKRYDQYQMQIEKPLP